MRLCQQAQCKAGQGLKLRGHDWPGRISFRESNSWTRKISGCTDVLFPKKDGGKRPPIVKSESALSLIFALASEVFELATLPFELQLILLNLLILAGGLIFAPL